MLVSVLFDSLRIALHDEGLLDGVYEYSESMLRGLITSVFVMGEVPCSLELSGEDETLAISPDPSAPAAGVIVIEAALQWFGGQVASSYKTRALSVSLTPAALRDVMSNLRIRKQSLLESSNLCGANTGSASGGFGVHHDVCTYTWDECKIFWGDVQPHQVLPFLS